MEYLERYSTFLVFTGMIGKSLYHLFRPTSTMLHDEIRGFCQPCFLQIIEPRLSQKKSQLCAKGTRLSRLRENLNVPFAGKLPPVFPYKWKASYLCFPGWSVGRSYGYDIRTRVAKNHSKTVSSSLPYVNYTKYATVQIFNDEIQ